MSHPAPDHTEARRIFVAIHNPMISLFHAWRDRPKSARFEDYASKMQAAVEQAGGVYESAQKRPFGVVFATGQARYLASVTKKKVRLDVYGPLRKHKD